MKKFNIAEDIKKLIWIWGTCSVAHQAMWTCFDEVKGIKGIIDNNIKKQGDTFYGYKIYSFEDAEKYIEKEDIIVICCRPVYAKEIEEQIQKSSCKYQYCLFEEPEDERAYCYKVSKYLLGNCTELGYEERLISRCCTQKDFEREDFKWAANQLKLDITNRLERKHWEFIYIVNVLKQYGLLVEGKRGIGFAVGKEPLPSFFAARRINVLATDLNPNDERATNWMITGQHSKGEWEELYYDTICDKEDFRRLVSFRYIDMNYIPDDLDGFDFCWSSCAIEHVGSLQKAIECVKNMLKVLKPGGVAVNTTEFNLSSNEETLDEGNSILFRRKDFEALAQWCKDNGHKMEVSFKRGNMNGDRYVDIPPYFIYTKYHLTLMVEQYATTSFAIIIQKKK